jgi:hypothetical protein
MNKKKIICMMLVFNIILGFCACYPKIVDEQGVDRTLIDGFVVISTINNYNHVVYNQTTKVVYYLETQTQAGYLSPYLIYQDGCIYGAIFQNGEITPVPYASAPLS